MLVGIDQPGHDQTPFGVDDPELEPGLLDGRLVNFAYAADLAVHQQDGRLTLGAWIVDVSIFYQRQHIRNRFLGTFEDCTTRLSEAVTADTRGACSGSRAS